MTDAFQKAHYDRTSVYLEDRSSEPKHLFKVLGDRLVAALEGREECSLLDVGGAAGDFARYMIGRLSRLRATCLDADPKLVERGRERSDGCRFVLGDANDMASIADRSFDAVTMIGVLSIFDDFRPALSECLRVAADGGTVVVVAQFNEHPVDVLMRWRYSGDDGPYNLGYNLFSQRSVGEYLNDLDRARSFAFEKFELLFDLPRQEDPIRTWTERDANGNRVLKNGLQMEINLQLLTVAVAP